jgi:hypothetical protein
MNPHKRSLLHRSAAAAQTASLVGVEVLAELPNPAALPAATEVEWEQLPFGVFRADHLKLRGLQHTNVRVDSIPADGSAFPPLDLGRHAFGETIAID